MNDFESAIELYKKALELESQLPVVNFALALAYQGIGKFDLAIDYANKTLKLDKDIELSNSMFCKNESLLEQELNGLGFKTKVWQSYNFMAYTVQGRL